MVHALKCVYCLILVLLFGQVLLLSKQVNNKDPNQSAWMYKLSWIVTVFVLRFYDPVNPMRSCGAWSVYLTTRLLDRLSPLNG